MTTSKLRAIKRNLLLEAIAHYGSYDEVPRPMKNRLERQSILLGKEGSPSSWKDPRNLSHILMSTRITLHEEERPRKFRLQRFLFREACREIGLSSDDRTALLRGLSRDGDLLEKAYYFFSSNNADYWRTYIDLWGMSIERALARARGAHTRAEREERVPWSEVHSIIEAFSKWFSVLRERPVFCIDRKRSPDVFSLEEKYTWIENYFLNRDIVADIESRPVIGRGNAPVFATTISSLDTWPYDISRVRSFTLLGPDGKECRIVSKRLFPLKSAFAEDEYRNSKLLFDLGLPLPEPIGVIRARGNQYHFWRHLDVRPTAEYKTYQTECDLIQRVVTNLGITNCDWAPRNFVPALRNGMVHAHMVDCERLYMSPQVRRLLGKLVRQGLKVLVP